MDYQKIYNSICDRGQKRPKTKGIYYEKHHIIPKGMGGDNSISNLTIITIREHFLCHWLLTRIYPTNKKLMNALGMLIMDKFGKRKLNEWRKRLCSKYVSLSKTGVPMTGKGAKGVPKSKSHRQKIGKSHKGIPNTGKAAKGVPKPLVTCPHCNKIGGVNTMHRWHFDNCKLK